MLRKDFILWLIKNVVKVSEACVILQNISLLMNEEGSFSEDDMADKQRVNLVTGLSNE